MSEHSRTGCFITGIAIGFVLATALGIFIFFRCNPDAAESVRSAFRRLWTSVKDDVDSTLDKPGPGPAPHPKRPPEPRISGPGPAPRGNHRPAPAPAPAYRPAPAAQPPAGQPLPRARIEINL